MNKSLVAYFSATGTTEGAANALAKAARADLYRITPAQPYSSRDLNWNNSSSRSSVEMGNDSARPALAQVAPDLSPYDVVFVDFPIWWYVEPRIVDTFLESCDLSGKAVVPFATSGSSGITRAASRMRDIVPQARVLDGRMMNDKPSTSELEAWIRGLGL